jgi:hypothetical protein
LMICIKTVAKILIIIDIGHNLSFVPSVSSRSIFNYFKPYLRKAVTVIGILF